MIKILGIGPGDSKYLTYECLEAVKHCDYIIGSKRQLESISELTSGKLIAYSGRLDDLSEKLKTALEKSSKVGLLASGDPSFYGISQWVYRTFPETEIEIINGIGSYQILFAKIGYPMHDIYMTSLHGRELSPKDLTLYKRMCLLTDNRYTPYRIAQMVLSEGHDPIVIIGESLSYENEQIHTLRASEVVDRKYEMNVVILDYER